MPQRRSPLLTAAALLAALLVPSHASALPSTADDGAWVTQGNVYAMARSGDTTYLGGEFTYVGPRTGSAVELSKSNAALVPSFPEVSGGAVHAVEPDGSGGWYIGGSFTHVDGQPRTRIAHVLPGGGVDPAFNPGANQQVLDIERSNDGATLFVGGFFTEIGGELRQKAAALQASTGTVLPGWNAGTVDQGVWDLAVSPTHPYVYAVGTFSTIGGETRARFAELNEANGNASSAYATGADSTVQTVEVSADGNTIYVGGSFANIGGAPRNDIAAFGYSPAVILPWDPNITGLSVKDIDVAGTTVYVAGEFTAVGVASRRNLAAINSGGSATAWNPNPTGLLTTVSPDASSVAVDGSTVYVGGLFTHIDGQPRNGLAAVDATTGDPTGWHGNVADAPWTIDASGPTVVAAGSFNTAKGVRRANLAALDGSGVATEWNPGTGFNETVLSLATSPDGSRVYVGGNFSELAGQPRRNLGAVNSGGGVTSWDPNPENEVRALAVSGDGATVFAGGGFSSIGGQTRNYLAALSASSGNATAWNPDLQNNVNVLLPRPGSGTILAGGDFTMVGTATRNYLAEIGTASGTATAWHPNLDGAAYDLAFSPGGSTLYVGGDFGMVGTTPRNYLAEVSLASGAPTGWNPGSTDVVFAIAPSSDGATVFAGGGFSGPASIGGVERDYLAEINAGSGTVTSWNPAPDDQVRALEPSGPDLLVAGEFDSIGSRGHRGFGRFSAPPPPPGPPPAPAAPPPPPPPAVPDTLRPTLSAVSVRPSVFAVGRTRTPAVVARRVPRGTRFRWTLSEQARTRIVLQQEVAGLRVGRRCRVATRTLRARLPRARKCTILRSAGTLSRPGKAGRNSTPFSGRIGRRTLKLGKYRATFRATDAAGNRSAAKRVRFRVARFSRR